MLFCKQIRCVVVCLILAALIYRPSIGAEDPYLPSDSELDARIQRLIERLGDERYTSREKAQAELSKLGFAAFEALNDAQDHDDIEVALRAQYLVRSMRINWTRDDDPAAVKTILKGYEQLGDDQRFRKMTALAQLETIRGKEALCRLTRFERTDLLSKQAALLIMSPLGPDRDIDRDELQKTILAALGGNKRPATKWLRIYANSLTKGNASVGQWDQMVKVELELLSEALPEQTSPQIARDLLRRQVEMLRHLKRLDDAAAATRRLFALIDGSPKELLDTVDWLTEQKSWDMIVELIGRYPESADRKPLLLYRLAQAHGELGNSEQADDAAKRALKIDPAAPEKHKLAAYELQNRGMFDWAEQEYRYAIKLGPPGGTTHLSSHFLLSEMLHDIAKDLAAAQVLEDVIEVMEKDASARILAGRIGRQPATVKSRMNFFFAEHFATQKDTTRVVQHLDAAAKNDPTDADVLIAMFRLPGQDEKWRLKTKKLIASSTQAFRKRIKESPEYPTYYNQLAWLVANTEGDFDEALRCSQKSLELLPNSAGYLDTLAHCYFAVGDLKNAVATQTRAVRLEPYSGQIRRAYDRFKKAASEK